MMNYSQNKEQEVILDYFKYSVKGNFLDIGANDGETLSNTRALALKGWSGVVVEPTKQAFDKLKKLYNENKRVHCIKKAIGTENKFVEISVNGNHIGETDTGLLSTVKEGEKKRWYGELWNTEKVEMVNYKTLIELVEKESGDKGFSFDFISIDAEGCDLEILHQIDLSGVRMLCIEWNNNNNVRTQINDICKSYELSLIHSNAENLIYAKR